MSILTKPYEISVWEDQFDESGHPTEKRMGVIGSDRMLSQNRAIEPNLIRSANGEKKFSFKMYKKYIDNITGEEVLNPFSEWLVAERKVKLYYEDRWYDFIVNEVGETSTNYLFSYSLIDACVQELSKNGFGVTLDEKLMNNMGDAGQLAREVLSETDWGVESEVFVQTVDEALVYLKMPADLSDLDIYHIKDQIAPYTSGVTEEPLTADEKNKLEEKTVLGFYSCCKNKPHRFQFIYCEGDNPYDRDAEGAFNIKREDDRTIVEKDCQYYIDFSDPESDYAAPGSAVNGHSNGAEELDLWLPKGFVIGTAGKRYSNIGSLIEEDSTLSAWFRGKRYGYAQQAVYVPMLERYCQKFKRDGQIPLTLEQLKVFLDYSTEEGAELKTLSYKENDGKLTFSSQKGGAEVGYKIEGSFHAQHTYIMQYKLKISSPFTLSNLSGYNPSFHTVTEVFSGDRLIARSVNDLCEFSPALDFESGEVLVKVYCNRIVSEQDKYPQYLIIQPNKGINTRSIAFTVTDLELCYDENYLGYTDSEFISPTLIQNCITNYNFESTSGWTATTGANIKATSSNKPSVESVYGYFDNSSPKKFVSAINNFLDGKHSNSSEYTPYMKLTFKNKNQFVLNSGIFDNRTVIENIPIGEEWVLDCVIRDANGNSFSGLESNIDFDFSIGEYIYDVDSGGYKERTGLIAFTKLRTQQNGEGVRVFFVADSSSYDADTFKKNSKIYLKITPTNDSFITENNSFVPIECYVEHIALYRKSIGKDGNIIVPDIEETNSTAETFVETGVIEHKYHYFNEWLIDSENEFAVTEKDKLPTEVRTSLDYKTYVPVYNEGAKKVRSVTVKESNYFNILQSIAETFEAWLDLEIKREDPDQPGRITGKSVRFKNYLGKDNYANFRYGVNLKDIQRVTSSKNIVTKLIVKQNTNELAKDGFCTIQRAGANPTGENYIYDFQYYHNMRIMDVNDYLKTAYYTNGAAGPDAEINSTVASNEEYNLNGYYPRLKKINEAILPISEELTGLNADLLKKKAELEVEEAAYEASISGIETTRENFYALANVYPEEAQSDAVISVRVLTEQEEKPENEGGLGCKTVEPKEKWWHVKKDENGKEDIKINNNYVGVTAVVSQKTEKIYGLDITPRSIEELQTGSGYYKFTSPGQYSGLSINTDWEEGREYILTYDIEVHSGQLTNIGWHTSYFSGNEIIIKDRTGRQVGYVKSNNTCTFNQGISFKKGERYSVTITATRKLLKDMSQAEKEQSPEAWIQPNKTLKQDITCTISNIVLTRILVDDEVQSDEDRDIHFYLNVMATIEGKEEEILRTYDIKGTIKAGRINQLVKQKITAVDLGRSDIQRYFTEYITYHEERERSFKQKEALKITIANKEEEIRKREQEYQKLLEYKKALNNLFFKKYSQFIKEGTWIDEQYVDDEKYYADAQSVLYNSCYPQVTYAINVIALSSLPGYEDFVFELGDKTKAIDDDFFGKNVQTEVVIVQLSENLDNPTKNTIKVQTFKNQFQDLFQKITATVQQTQYNEGSYKKGEALVDANFEKQSEFITKAINGAEAYLSHGQTVKSGTDGITITDDANKQNRLRLVGGAILFGTLDPNTKEPTWMTGITKDGMSANLITAGRIDAGMVQIMCGDDPVFRWDAYGISAYDAYWGESDDLSVIEGIDTEKFVRFDKFGIYGVDHAPGVDGATWHPSSIDDIARKSSYHLTWDGLKVTPENLGYSTTYTVSGEKVELNGGSISPDPFSIKLGRIDDLIYNKWSDTGLPCYDEEATNKKFVKVFAVGDQVGEHASENFVLYSDGTLVVQNIKLPGSIQWTEASSPSKNLYGANNTTLPQGSYSDFEDNIGDWHKVYNEEADRYYCHTDNGGATWQGPFAISGPQGPQGPAAINCYIDSSSGSILPEVDNDDTTTIILTARIFEGQEVINDSGSWIYDWTIEREDGSSGSLLDKNGAVVHTKTITVLVKDIQNQTVYFTAQKTST